MEKLVGKAIIAMGGGTTAVINQSLVGAALQARQYPHRTQFYGAFLSSPAEDLNDNTGFRHTD